MNNEYSSDTKKVAAKLAGMTEACANVHDDERLTELFALAPDWAVGIVTEENGRRFWSTKVAEIGESDESAIKRMQYIDQKGNKDHQGELWQEIPPRERDLNQLAQDMGSWYEVQDYAELSEFRTVKVNGEWFRFQEWKERREQRIAAGLIDVDDTDVVDMQDSQQEWMSGRPLFGVKCEWRVIAPDEDGKIAPTAWDYCNFIAEFDGNVIFKKAGSLCEFKKEIIEFRPIKPEQKPDERDAMISDMAKVMFEAGANIGEPGVINDTTLGDLYDWLKSTGRLTQGGDDE